MKERKEVEIINDEELIEKFNQAIGIQDKLQYFSRIRDYNVQMELLSSVPSNEKYKFIGKIKSTQGIAKALNNLEDDKAKSKTFNFVAKQFKGNNEGLLRIITQIDFDVELPSNMLTFQINSLNALNLDFLINIQRHIINHSKMKFKINEKESDSTNIEYSFGEMSAIIAKIEELTADIPKDMNEANKFYTIYSRLARIITYDHPYLKKHDNAKDKFYHRKGYTNIKNFGYEQYSSYMKDIRRKPAGLYGGLVEGKSVCAGYALILHEALRYVGLKSQYVVGVEKFGVDGESHAWTHVQIDGEWYNTDLTWDANTLQIAGRERYMLLDDETFDISHGKYGLSRTATYHKCTSKFDYSKIKGQTLTREGIGKEI